MRCSTSAWRSRLDGERLSAAEIKALLAGGNGLQLIRGRWVEVDRKKLGRMLERFQAIERAAAENGLPFAEAMRLVAGASLDEAGDSADADWSQLVAGPWLAETLQGLRQPEGLAQVSPGAELKATLRPYQQAGVRWLYLLTRLGLGACLADDMGLGKTIQVLSLLLILKRETARKHRPSLLVAPASLLANWAAEAERFCPEPAPPDRASLGVAGRRIASAGCGAAERVSISSSPPMARCCARRRWQAMQWRLAVLDEAQAIKNPGAKQTRQVKKLNAQSRIALTGTPVENRLSDLWSIFDFTHPGLLGHGQGLCRLSPNDWPGRTLRPAARPGAPLHPAAPENRQAGDRRFAGQDGTQGVVPPQSGAGRAVSACGEGTGRRAGGCRRDRSQGGGACPS